GIVVHHDPVTKQKGSGANTSSKRRATQNTAANSAVTTPAQVIPEAAKSALAQIAASTIPGAPEAKDAESAPVTAKKPRSRKKPATKATLAREAEQLLDSVFDALPEPKAPGQGRGRRRVTTGALSTATPKPESESP